MSVSLIDAVYKFRRDDLEFFAESTGKYCSILLESRTVQEFIEDAKAISSIPSLQLGFDKDIRPITNKNPFKEICPKLHKTFANAIFILRKIHLPQEIDKSVAEPYLLDLFFAVISLHWAVALWNAFSDPQVKKERTDTNSLLQLLPLIKEKFSTIINNFIKPYLITPAQIIPGSPSTFYTTVEDEKGLFFVYLSSLYSDAIGTLEDCLETLTLAQSP